MSGGRFKLFLQPDGEAKKSAISEADIKKILVTMRLTEEKNPSSIEKEILALHKSEFIGNVAGSLDSITKKRQFLYDLIKELISLLNESRLHDQEAIKQSAKKAILRKVVENRYNHNILDEIFNRLILSGSSKTKQALENLLGENEANELINDCKKLTYEQAEKELAQLENPNEQKHSPR